MSACVNMQCAVMRGLVRASKLRTKIETDSFEMNIPVIERRHSICSIKLAKMKKMYVPAFVSAKN